MNFSPTLKRWKAHRAYLEQVFASLHQKHTYGLKLKRVLGHIYFVVLLEFRWFLRGLSRPCVLDRPVIVSITSYPPRFPTLYLSLQCLLTQSVHPAELKLWIAREDANELPEIVKLFEGYGLKICYCEDLRSYKKIVPALLTSGFDVYHVICDDDQHYPRDWLAKLVHDQNDGSTVVCYHGLLITAEERKIKPYGEWRKPQAPMESPQLVAIGAGGVLYPPHLLPRDAVDQALFSELCPAQDDIWLYWMARLNGAKTRLVSCSRSLPNWLGTQAVGLWHENNPVGCGNDQAVERMVRHFGIPFDTAEEAWSRPQKTVLQARLNHPEEETGPT